MHWITFSNAQTSDNYGSFQSYASPSLCFVIFKFSCSFPVSKIHSKNLFLLALTKFGLSYWMCKSGFIRDVIVFPNHIIIAFVESSYISDLVVAPFNATTGIGPRVLKSFGQNHLMAKTFIWCMTRAEPWYLTVKVCDAEQSDFECTNQNWIVWWQLHQLCPVHASFELWCHHWC